jgi:hypothetical protein
VHLLGATGAFANGSFSNSAFFHPKMPYIKPQKKKASNDGVVQALVKRYPVLKIFFPKFVRGGIKFEEVCRDPEGKLNEDMVAMQTGGIEKRRWMKFWLDCTTKADKYTMTSDQFLLYFNLVDNIWMRRLFDIINHGLTGQITFAEFFSFCRKYIIVDKTGSIEFCFRMLSRRGMSFNELYSCLDAEDVKHFLVYRYYGKLKGQRCFELSRVKKQSKHVVSSITESAELQDGTIFIKDFEWFASHNATFVKFTHHVQMHFRKCIFGMGFWVNKSRAMAYAKKGGMLSLSIASRANADSEAFATVSLLDPVVDKNGYPVKLKAKVKPAAKQTQPLNTASVGSLPSSPVNSRPATRDASHPGTHEASRPTTGALSGVDAGPSVETAGTLGAGNSMLSAPGYSMEGQRKKKMLKFYEPFDTRT